MRYLKLILIVVFCLIGYTAYKYYTYKKFFSPKLEFLSEDLTVPVINYANKFENEDLTNPQSFEKMKKWIKENYSVLDENEAILKYGYEIKYDRSSEFYLFSLYGEDNKVSDRNISISGIDKESLFSMQKPSFTNYLFKSKNYDIILFGYKKPSD